MDSLSPQVVSAAKLPILNPNEFDLWKMRIEQYFLMTGYSLWEVILIGDSPAPTRVVDGVLQPVAPITAEQKSARKNEVKARDTLLMALADKHQLKFNSHKDAKTLMEAIEKRFGGNTKTKKVQKTLLKQQYENFTGSSLESLDQIHDKLQKLISQLEIHRVFLFQEDVNLNAAASVSAVCAKMPVSSLPNIDSLSNARTERNLGANGPTSLGFDMSKVVCYNCHRKGHFARECRYPKDSRRNGAAKPQRRNVQVKPSTSNALVSQCDGVGSYDWSFQVEEEPANYALMAFSCSSSSSKNESDESWPPSSLYDRFQPSDGYHAVPPSYTGTFMPSKPDLVFYNAPNGVETDHLAFTVKLSPTKPDQALSLTIRPSAPIIEDWHIETSIPVDTSKPASLKPIGNGKRRNRKACFLCKSLDHLIKDYDYHEKKIAQLTARNHAHRGNNKHYASITHPNPQKHMAPAAVLTQSKPVPITAVRTVTPDVSKFKVTRPRHAKPIVTKTISPRSHSESLDQIHDRLQKLVNQLEIHGVSLSQEDVNLKTGRNLGANGPSSLGFDMSKVECYNCHRKGHFARECRSPKDSRRNGVADPQRRSVLVETSTSNALVS
nr:ribonuclease H-like domain-containing protein [Tanacetum cinerariifolium]